MEKTTPPVKHIRDTVLNFDITTEDLLRFNMGSILIRNVEKADLTLLQRMYEGANISNHKLLEKSREERLIERSPVDTIFSDMVLVIYDEAETNPSILDLFYENCKELFSAVYKKYQTFTTMLRSEPDEVLLKYLTTKISPQVYDIFFYFYLYEGDYRFNPEIDRFITDGAEETAMTFVEYINVDSTDGGYVFNTGKEIFSSPQFERFLKKQREKMADTANHLFNVDYVKEDNLDSFIQNVMRMRSDSGKSIFFPGFNITTNSSTLEIILAQKGGASWLLTMVNDRDDPYFKSHNYKPDVDRLIRIYFKSCVKQNWLTDNDNFTMVRLSREQMSPSPEIDLCSVLLLYDIDVMCRMVNNVKDEYYLNFSWEKIDNKKITERYDSRLAEMQNTINALNQKMEDMRHNYNAIKEQAFEPKENDTAELALKYERTLNSIEKNLEKKESEIDDLKRQLAIKDEYIELLLTAEDTDTNKEVDIASLQLKKYLFVGYVDNIPELRHTFPNSIFMETEQKSLAGIKVDAIVMLIKYMSHKMFYKIKNTAELADLPIIYCNTRNINSIYNDMASAGL